LNRNTLPTKRTHQRAHFTPASILNLTKALRAPPYELMQAEILQILNHVPKDTAEVQMLVEDAEQRFDTKTLEDIYELIRSTLQPLENGQS